MHNMISDDFIVYYDKIRIKSSLIFYAVYCVCNTDNISTLLYFSL